MLGVLPFPALAALQTAGQLFCFVNSLRQRQRCAAETVTAGEKQIHVSMRGPGGLTIAQKEEVSRFGSGQCLEENFLGTLCTL